MENFISETWVAILQFLQPAFEDFLGSPWLYVAMPFMSAIIGWGTNVLALKMMFLPIDFIGIKPIFGWQGIVPRKAGVMASIATETMLKNLVNVKEIFERMDPDRVAEVLEQPMLNMMDEIVDEVMEQHQPGLWETLPNFVKNQIYQSVRQDAPDVIRSMMGEIRDNVENVFDVKHMVVSNLSRDKELLNSIFLRTGEKEFKFIARSGLLFGFIFGTIQMLIYLFYKGPWVLPVAGLLVGYATNWIALKMIFRPKNPIKLGPLTFHGLFLKRQKEVARDYGGLIAEEIITPANMIEEILRGPLSDNLISLVSKHIKKTVDDQAGATKPFVVMAIGTEAYRGMKTAAVEAIMAKAPQTLKHLEDYAEDAMNLRGTISDRMQDLTPEQFESLLRPAFEQDEWMLILVGSALGFGVGVFQLVVMFGGTFMG